MNQAVVLDQDGRPGTVEAVSDESIRILLPNGVAVALDRSLVTRQPDGSYRADLRFLDLDTHVFQEVEEQLRIRTDLRETGRVVVRTSTDTVQAPVEACPK